jgi:hypothetical protein
MKLMDFTKWLDKMGGAPREIGNRITPITMKLTPCVYPIGVPKTLVAASL